MRTYRPIRLSLCLAGLLLVGLPVARIAAAQVRSGPETAPAGLKVELRLGDGKRTIYHMGEIVPFSLIFSATDHTKHSVSPEHCDIPGWYPTTNPPNALLTRDKKEVVPVSLCMGHGWSSEIDLAQTPWTLTFLLNHQYALDRPGSYELVWKGQMFGQDLTSNVVRLELLPSDPAWEAKQLGLADTALDMGGEHAKEGCEMLGYLGTPAAELDIARRYNGDSSCPRFRDALINAKDRDAVLRILEAKIDAPNEIISPEYLRNFATLSLYRAHPEWYDDFVRDGRPEYPPSVVEQETIRYTRRLVAALPSKQPYVRAQCIRNFAGFFALSPSSPGLPPDVDAALRQQMPAVFRELSEADQRSTLQGPWPGIASPAMVPVLVSIIENPTNTVRDDALVRLFELDPNQARTFLIQEIVREPCTSTHRCWRSCRTNPFRNSIRLCFSM